MSSLFPNVEKYSEDSLFVELKNEFDTNKKMVRNQKFIDNMLKKGFLKFLFFPFNLLMAFLTAQSKVMKIFKWSFAIILVLTTIFANPEVPWYYTAIALMFMFYIVFSIFVFDILIKLKKKNEYLNNYSSGEINKLIHTSFLEKTLSKNQMIKFKREINNEYEFKSAMDEECRITYLKAMKKLHEKYERDHEPPKTPKELEKEEKKKELEKMKSNIYKKL